MRIKSFSSMVSKIVMALVFAAMIGGVYFAPAFGKDGNDRRGYNTQAQHQQGRYEHGHYERGRYVPHTYYHPQPVYAPPPVVYAPAPSPGISLVFPIIIR